MNNAVLMNVFYCCEHLLQETKHISLHELSRMTLFIRGKILSFEIHYYEILLIRIFLANKITDSHNSLLPL